MGDAEVPAPCLIFPVGISPKPRSLVGWGDGRWGDGREVLASSRSFSASISSAVSEAGVTGPLSNLLSPAFPGIAAGLGSPPAACPTLLQGWQQAGESSSLQRRRFLETRNYQAGPNAPRTALSSTFMVDAGQEVLAQCCSHPAKPTAEHVLPGPRPLCRARGLPWDLLHPIAPLPPPQAPVHTILELRATGRGWL